MAKTTQINEYLAKIESEILTNIINKPIKMQNVVLDLESKDFSDHKNRCVYAALYQLNKQSIIIKLNTLIDFIANNPDYQFDHWKEYIETLANDFYNDDDLETNIQIIYNASTKRLLDEFARKTLETKMDFSQPIEKIYDLQKSFLDIIERKKSSTLTEIQKVMDICLSKISKNLGKSSITGTPVGFNEIDKITSGFQNGDLIILAARPGVGKTAISLNFLLNAARDIVLRKQQDKEKVVMFSLEMGLDQIGRRLISLASNIDGTKLRTSNLTKSEFDHVKVRSSEIASLPILIDDTSDLSVVDIQSKLKQIANQYTIKLVIVDYLQLIKAPKLHGQQQNRQAEISTISRMLKLFARQIKTPIIALAQLSRAIEKRGGNTEPILSDLRESGAIEQDADLVTFLYVPDSDSSDSKTATRLNVQYIIAKHRNGATARCNLLMFKSTGRFVQIDNNFSQTKSGQPPFMNESENNYES